MTTVSSGFMRRLVFTTMSAKLFVNEEFPEKCLGSLQITLAPLQGRPTSCRRQLTSLAKCETDCQGQRTGPKFRYRQQSSHPCPPFDFSKEIRYEYESVLTVPTRWVTEKGLDMLPVPVRLSLSLAFRAVFWRRRSIQFLF